MRRAVVRAAVLASRVPSTKTSMLAVASKMAAPRIAAPATVRYFSQTLRAANEDAFNAMQAEANEQSKPAASYIPCAGYSCDTILPCSMRFKNVAPLT